MPQNFIGCDREQVFLLPPSLREWLPEDHLAWFVLEAVEEMDLGEFYAVYREDGHGRAAYEPSMMVALLLYAYATKQRSSRAIERHCRQDVGYRVITANRVPDHATIARFVVRHEAALAELSSKCPLYRAFGEGERRDSNPRPPGSQHALAMRRSASAARVLLKDAASGVGRSSRVRPVSVACVAAMLPRARVRGRRVRALTLRQDVRDLNPRPLGPR
ncbi:MAG TPA: transposase [Thermoleophilaceae bacterium]|nr:transposase [Thermoleophilaceae bacterium]